MRATNTGSLEIVGVSPDRRRTLRCDDILHKLIIEFQVNIGERWDSSE